MCKCKLLCDCRGGHVEKQEKQQKNEKIKPKVRRHHTSKSDEPDLHESAFLKKIIAYQRKLLVQDTFLSFCFSSDGHLSLKTFSPAGNTFTPFLQQLVTCSVDSKHEEESSDAKGLVKKKSVVK